MLCVCVYVYGSGNRCLGVGVDLLQVSHTRRKQEINDGEMRIYFVVYSAVDDEEGERETQSKREEIEMAGSHVKGTNPYHGPTVVHCRKMGKWRGSPPSSRWS